MKNYPMPVAGDTILINENVESPYLVYLGYTYLYGGLVDGSSDRALYECGNISLYRPEFDIIK